MTASGLMTRCDGDEMRFLFRRAAQADAPRLADLYLCARRAALPAIPAIVHPDSDVHRWFRDVVIPERETWLVEDDSAVIAVMVLDEEDLDQLYVHPQWTGRGVGGDLVRRAKQRRPEGLSLWTFQSNHAAQRFYERHGFVAVEHTDGSGNEERAPDIRYVWSASSGQSMEMPEG